MRTATREPREPGAAPPLVSVIVPALNEAATIGEVVRSARAAMERCGYQGEIIVVDSDSADATRDIALRSGARVLQSSAGYGNACRAGLAAASGDYLVLVDGDGTYDVSPLHRFIEPLRAGADLVVGTRRNGLIHPGAMAGWHRHVLEPLQTYLLRRKLDVHCSDVRSGMRALRRDALDQLDLSARDMSLAPEMIRQAWSRGLEILEVPVPFHPRPGGHARRTSADGWVVVRDILLTSPLGLFMFPGLALLALGLATELTLLGGPVDVGPFRMDYHFMFVGGAAAIFGLQLVLLGLSSATYVLVHDPAFAGPRIRAFHRAYTLERGTLVGLGFMLIGASILFWLGAEWLAGGMGDFFAVRQAMAATTLLILGGEILFGSFLLSLFRKGVYDVP